MTGVEDLVKHALRNRAAHDSLRSRPSYIRIIQPQDAGQPVQLQIASIKQLENLSDAAPFFVRDRTENKTKLLLLGQKRSWLW